MEKKQLKKYRLEIKVNGKILKIDASPPVNTTIF